LKKNLKILEIFRVMMKNLKLQSIVLKLKI